MSMAHPAVTRFQRLTTNYPVSFLLWLIGTGLTILNFIYGRLLVMALVGLLPLSPELFVLLDRVLLVGFGLLGLILVIYLEHHYRTGVKRRQLWTRFRQVTTLQVGLILAGLLYSWLPLFYPEAIP